MKHIKEEDGIHKEWHKEAKEMTMEKLPEFIRKLTEDYGHDYGTIVHALTAGAIGTMWAMDRTPHGGIAGFQAGCIMWQFIREWNKSGNKCGMALLDYDNLLYPQYEYKFDKAITPSAWEAIQKEAKKHLEESEKAQLKYNGDIYRYGIDLSVFVEKYPDYNDNPEKYDRIGMGTGDEWDAQKKKEDSGFEFAPTKPYNTKAHPEVIAHWISIVEGVVPFGFKVKED